MTLGCTQVALGEGWGGRGEAGREEVEKEGRAERKRKTAHSLCREDKHGISKTVNPTGSKEGIATLTFV